MKRPSLILILGVLAGLIAFAAASRLQTLPHRRLLNQPTSELAWLRHEFNLSEAEFQRVLHLHNAYQPTCADLCRRIAESNQRLREAIARTNVVTDDIRERMLETGRARDDCRQAMLTHLFAVAREMPPEAGRRYLETMLAATCVVQEARPLHALPADSSSPAGDPHHHHE